MKDWYGEWAAAGHPVQRSWGEWKSVHQPYELDHWVHRGGIEWSEGSDWSPWWRDIFDFIEPRGKLLDVGCGPRPPFGPGSTAIDPLIDEYRRHTPVDWWYGVATYALPAERLVPELTGRFDTVMCWNCIDHAIGWDQILVNIAAYGKEDATFVIATDFNPPAPGHPGFERADFERELHKLFRVIKARDSFKDRDLAMVLACV